MLKTRWYFFTSVPGSLENYSSITLWSTEIKALGRPWSPAHQGTKLKPSFFLSWASLWPTVCTCMPTHTHTHTQSQILQHKGIPSEVDPYRVPCQSPGAMRYLVPRICLNILASLFGSAECETQLWHNCKLFINVINCVALSSTEKLNDGNNSQFCRERWAQHIVLWVNSLELQVFFLYTDITLLYVRFTHCTTNAAHLRPVSFIDNDVTLCPWHGHTNKGCKTLIVSIGQSRSCTRVKYWHAYLSVSCPCRLPLYRSSCLNNS